MNLNMNLPTGKLIDISLPLDARTFHMRTYGGFKKDMQFEVEVLKVMKTAATARSSGAPTCACTQARMSTHPRT